MKNTLTLILLVCLFFHCHSQNLLNNPESIVYDYSNNRYLVSNCGDGSIVQIDSNGLQSYFNTELTSTLGLHIVGDTLFVSSNSGPYTGIVGFLLSTGEIVFHVEIQGNVLLNDITSDNSGNLYITDSEANKMFKIHISSMTSSTLIDSGLGYPNGILFDEANNRLIVLNGTLPGKPILSVSLDDLSVTTIVETDLYAIDGLTEDDYGNYYFSSWYTDKVYRYDEYFTNPPEIIAEGFTDPADIFYNKAEHVLAIPNFNADTIVFLYYNPVSVEDISKDKAGSLHTFPNPFTSEINIQSTLFTNAPFVVSIYDINGKMVERMQNERMDNVVFDGNGLEPGVYIVNVNSAGSRQYCRIIKQ